MTRPVPPAAPSKIPATVVTGFLGAGKTTLLRHLIAHANGRRLAIIVNEFGTVGVDGDLLRACGIDSCGDEDIVELANGCLCCTVAEDFLPTMEALLARPQPPDHILIETSGLALPKPLLKAFDWPTMRSRVTVDGVIAVVDGPAAAAGRFAEEPLRPGATEHDSPLLEVYQDQLAAADLVLVNKSDLMDPATLARLHREIDSATARPVKILATSEGRVDPRVLLGLDAAAEDDLAGRPSLHDALGNHEHNDFESFVVDSGEIADPAAVIAALEALATGHEVLRVKGFLAVAAKPLRLLVQGVGQRFRHHYERPWGATEPRRSRLVVIGRSGLDRPAIEQAIRLAVG